MNKNGSFFLLPCLKFSNIYLSPFLSNSIFALLFISPFLLLFPTPFIYLTSTQSVFAANKCSVLPQPPRCFFSQYTDTCNLDIVAADIRRVNDTFYEHFLFLIYASRSIPKYQKVNNSVQIFHWRYHFNTLQELTKLKERHILVQ